MNMIPEWMGQLGLSAVILAIVGYYVVRSLELVIRFRNSKTENGSHYNQNEIAYMKQELSTVVVAMSKIAQAIELQNKNMELHFQAMRHLIEKLGIESRLRE